MGFNNDPQQPGWAAPAPPPNWQQPRYAPPSGYPPTPQPGYSPVPPPGYMPPSYYGMPGSPPPPQKSRLPKIIGAIVLIVVLGFGGLMAIGYMVMKADEGKTYFSLTPPSDGCDLPHHITSATTDNTVYFVANMKDTLASSENLTLTEKLGGTEIDSGVVPGDNSGKDFSCVTYNQGLNFEMPGTYTIELNHNGKLESTGDITITAGAGGGGVPIPSSFP
jgi:hypothetical protein